MEPRRRTGALEEAALRVCSLCRLAASHSVADTTANRSLRDMFLAMGVLRTGTPGFRAYIKANATTLVYRANSDRLQPWREC